MEEKFLTPDQLQAKGDFDRFMRYLDANPHIVNSLVDYLTKRCDQHKHIGNAEAAAYLRGHQFVASSGDDFKVNNNMIPVLMRLVGFRNPRIASHIERRGSRFDVFFDAWAARQGGDSDAC